MSDIKTLSKLFGTLCLCLCLCSLPVGNLNYSSAAIAGNEISAAAVTASKDNLTAELANFLHDIPRGYYTVKGVGALKKLMGREDHLLVDVREPGEYAIGHIGNAINIPLRTLTENLDKIPKNSPVVLYCTSGYRTAMGVMTLRMLGYENVRAFPPSIQGWKAAGESLTK